MMTNCVLVTVFTVVCLGLVQGASLPSDKQTNHEAGTFRFGSCRLPSNPTPNDLIQYRLCIKRILDREGGGTDEGGRWGRSTDDKFRRQMEKFKDVAELLYTGSGKHRLPRSLEALCAGDLSHYDHEVREYIQWRCKNGYGTLMRRWGRSATFKMVGDSTQGESKSNSAWRRYHWPSNKDRSKREDVPQGDDIRAIVKAYKEWRSSNGYGQKGGRWG